MIRLVDKPSEPDSYLAVVSVYLFTSAVPEGVQAREQPARCELEFVDAVQWPIHRGDAFRHELLEVWWLDTGQNDSLLETSRRLREAVERYCDGSLDGTSEPDGPVVAEAGAKLVNTVVRGPAAIGVGATLIDSSARPLTSSGDEQGSFVETNRGRALLGELGGTSGSSRPPVVSGTIGATP